MTASFPTWRGCHLFWWFALRSCPDQSQNVLCAAEQHRSLLIHIARHGVSGRRATTKKCIPPRILLEGKAHSKPPQLCRTGQSLPPPPSFASVKDMGSGRAWFLWDSFGEHLCFFPECTCTVGACSRNQRPWNKEALGKPS